MSRTRRFLDGVILSYANQVIVILVGLWLTPFLLRQLGQHDFGLWLIGLQALSYLTLLDIGVLGLLPREVAYAKGRIATQGRADCVQKLVEETLVVILLQTPLLAIAAAIAWLLIPSADPRLRSAIALVLVVFTAQFPFRTFYATLEGMQDFAFVGSLQFFAWFAGVATNVALVLRGRGLYGLAVGWGVNQGVIAIGSIWRLYLAYPHCAPRSLRWIHWRVYWRHLGSGFWVSLSQIAQTLRGSDPLLVGKVLGASAVVPFSCTSKLVTVLANQPQTIMQAAQPGMSELRVTSSKEHLATVVGSLTQAMLMLSGAVAIAVIAINRPFVTRWVGGAQYLGFTMTALLLVSMMLKHWNVTNVYTLFCFGSQRYISLVAVADAACNVGATMLLLHVMGLLGAPLGSLAATIFISLPLNLYALRRELDVPLRLLVSPLLRWFVPFLGSLAVVVWLSRQFNPNGYPGIAALGSAALLIYAIFQWRTIQASHWGNHLGIQLAGTRAWVLEVVRSAFA